MNTQLSDDLLLDLFKVLASHNLISENALRDATIKKEFSELRATGKRVFDIMEELGDKHCLSEKSIDRIVYPGNKIKKRKSIHSSVLAL